MAEIYKQQLQHNVTDGSKLGYTPFKNYIAEGFRSAAEGFHKLDEYFVYLDDKDLASKMEATAKEASNKIDEWKDFNTDGRTELMSQVMDMYDRTLSSANIDAQGRLNAANPEARRIFELKMNEAILKKAKEQVYVEKQRDFNAMADIVANVRDTSENEKMLRAALDKVQNNEGDLLDVKQIGELTDRAGHDIVLQTIDQAIIEGRAPAAESYLNNPFYLRFLGPTEKNRLRKELVSLQKSQTEDRASGGNYTDIASMLIAGRDAAMKVYGATPEGRLAVDEDYNKFVRALKNGESMKGLTMYGRPFNDFLTENGMQAMEYWDSLPMTTRQLAANKYEETLSGLYPEYKERQNYLATVFSNSLSNYTNEGTVDITNMPNDEYREFVANVMELRGLRSGLDNSQQKLLDGAISAITAKRYAAGKAASVELNTVQQNMAGFTSGKTFLGGGNLTEAMVRSQQNGEEPISVIDSMLNNSVAPGNSELAKDLRAAGSALDKYGTLLGSGELAPFFTDFANMFDDGGFKNSQAIAASVGSLMKEMGEVDSKGNLVVPQANSYRFMTYAVPIILSYISVMGNGQDLTNTGIKKGAINNVKTVDLVFGLQDVYKNILDEPVDVLSEQDITKSGFYDMLSVALSLGKKEGLVALDVQPNSNAIAGLASVLKDLAVDSPAYALTPAKDSGAKKRIDYKTKPMFQFKE